MKFDLQTTISALALLLLGYSLGKRNAAQAAGASGAVIPTDAKTATQGQAEWWTFAGSWHV